MKPGCPNQAILEDSFVGEADVAVFGNNYVVSEVDVHQLAGVSEITHETNVCLAGSRVS